MTPPLWIGNLIAWSAQVAALVAAAAVLLALLRVTAPRVRLACWRALLVTCLALPLVQPWRPAPGLDATVSTGATTAASAIEPVAAAEPVGASLVAILAVVLIAGTFFRLAWLGLGLLRLARYRRDATVLDPLPPALEDAAARAGSRATIAVAEGLSGPVTFGLQRPVVLLPPAVLTLDPALQRSVACHELLHVGRRDWLWSVTEEVVCAVAWFHPAIWWLAAQIDLAREQHVDVEVVRLTGDRKPYLEALLYLASPERGADLAPAPALLRRRHLAKRLLVLVKEVSMSRPRIVLSVAAVIVLLTLTAGAAAVSFPLVGGSSAEPSVTSQAVGWPADNPSVTTSKAQVPVRVGGAIKPPKKIRDVRPVYPPDAREAGVQGVVILDVLIAPDGTVGDAKVLRSIPLLDQAALDALRQWEFEPTLVDGAPVPVVMTVTVNFTLDSVAEQGGVPGGVPDLPPPKKIFDVKPIYPEDARRQGVAGVVILQAAIDESGLVSDVKVLRSIPLLDQAAIDAVRQWQFEPQARAVTMTTTVRFALDKTSPDDPGPGELRSPGAREFAFTRVPYPPEAVAAKIEGTVILDAVIGVSGKVVSVKLVDGPGLLAQGAIEAVRQWEFRSVTSPQTARIEIEYSLQDGKPVTSWAMRIAPQASGR
jgi:TonB family protein